MVCQGPVTPEVRGSNPSKGQLLSRGGLEVERLLHKLHDSTSVGSNPARPQNDFRSNSNTTGGALINNVQKLMRLSSLD